MKAYLVTVILATLSLAVVTLGDTEIREAKQEVKAAKAESKCLAARKQLRVDSKPVPVHCTRAQRLKLKKD